MCSKDWGPSIDGIDSDIELVRVRLPRRLSLRIGGHRTVCVCSDSPKTAPELRPPVIEESALAKATSGPRFVAAQIICERRKKPIVIDMYESNALRIFIKGYSPIARES